MLWVPLLVVVLEQRYLQLDWNLVFWGELVQTWVALTWWETLEGDSEKVEVGKLVFSVGESAGLYEAGSKIVGNGVTLPSIIIFIGMSWPCTDVAGW